VVNPGFVIGPGDVHRVSSWPVEEYVRGTLRFTVPGGLSYVDVRDVVAGALAADERGRRGERYVITNDEGNLSHADFFDFVGRVTGRPRRTLPLPARALAAALRAGSVLRLPLPLDDQELLASAHWWFYTAAKARRELGFAPRPLETTIADTVDWLRAAGYRRHGGLSAAPAG
jgi:dihydroflavonol-4-reductase